MRDKQSGTRERERIGMGRARGENRYSEEGENHGDRDGRDIGSERAN